MQVLKSNSPLQRHPASSQREAQPGAAGGAEDDGGGRGDDGPAHAERGRFRRTRLRLAAASRLAESQRRARQARRRVTSGLGNSLHNRCPNT